MKSLSRFFSLLIVLTLVLGAPVLSAFAQGDNPACAGLDAADCETVTAASAAMAGVTSFRMPAFSISLNASDGMENVSFSMSGSGEIMAPPDPANPTEGLLLHLVLDEVMVSDPDSGEQSGSAEILVLGDMGYVNYNGQWYGEQMSPSDIQEMTDTFGMSGGGMGDLSSLGLDLTGVATTARGEDGDMMGQVTQSYVTTVDINGLLTALVTSPMFGELLGMGMGAEGDDMGMDQMTPEDMQMMAAIFAPMLTGTSITFTQWIGVDDNLIHMLSLDATLNLDLSMLSGMSEDPTSEPEAITGELHLSVELADHNGSFTVEAPADYAPMEDLEAQGGLFGDMGM